MDQKSNVKLNAQTTQFTSLTISFPLVEMSLSGLRLKTKGQADQFFLKKQNSKVSRKGTHFPTCSARVAGAPRNKEEGREHTAVTSGRCF